MHIQKYQRVCDDVSINISNNKKKNASKFHIHFIDNYPCTLKAYRNVYPNFPKIEIVKVLNY